MRGVLVCAVIALLACSAAAYRTGAKATFSLQGIEDIKNTILPVVLKNLGQISLPEEHSASFPLGVRAWIKDIVIANFDIDLPNSKIQFVPDHSAVLEVQHLKADIAFTWGYKNWLWGDSGMGMIKLGDSFLNCAFSVSVDEAGHANVHFDNVAVDIKDFYVHVDCGVWSKLFGRVIDWFTHTLTAAILNGMKFKEALPAKFLDMANQMMQHLLQSQPVAIDLFDTPLALSYALSKSPVCSNDIAAVSFSAFFYEQGKPIAEPPVADPVSIPDFFPDPDHNAFQMLFTEYFANTAQYVMYATNWLNVKLTNAMVPKELALRLGTEDFKELLPGMEAKWPEHEFEAHISIYEPPYTKLTKGKISGHMSALVKFVIVPEQETAIAFKTGVDFALEAYANNTRICGKVLEANLGDFTLTENNIGDFVLSDLHDLFSFLVQAAVPEFSSRLLEQGFELPRVDGGFLGNPKIYIHDGFLQVSGTPMLNMADVNFVPAPSNNNAPAAPLPSKEWFKNTEACEPIHVVIPPKLEL